MVEYFTDMTWGESIKDIIDILIVTYIIYQMILLVRGTRAVQLLKGILVLVVIWALSTWFDLYTLKWLMNQIFTFGVLAIFIIFQPELRRGLEQLGRGKLFGRTADIDEETNKLISETIKAVNYLSRRKIGALIVFERTTGLNEYVESGIPMGSVISSELFINILYRIRLFMTEPSLFRTAKSRPQAVIYRYRRILSSVRNWGRGIVPLSESVKWGCDFGCRIRGDWASIAGLKWTSGSGY